MGCDCTTYFPKGTKAVDVADFLNLLGFTRLKKGRLMGGSGVPYGYYKDDDYKYITGLYAELYTEKDGDGGLRLWTRTTIWRSKFDSDFHNYAIQQLRKRFGGHFISDYGRNRYFQFDGPVRQKAEAGAYRAFSRFTSNIRRAHHCMRFANLLDEEKHKISGVDFIDATNPRIITSNVLVPFVVSAIEDYFRSLYVALLRYSPARERIIQNARLQGADIVSIDKGELAVPEAVARWMNFQEMSKINNAFKDLNGKYDICGVLKRPYGRRQEKPWDTLSRLVAQRHDLIHRAEMSVAYKPTNLKADIQLVEKAVGRVYDELIKYHKWQAVERWDF